MDPGFFYETVAPLLIVGNTSLLCISTLTSEVNFYTRLMKMVDPGTNQSIFTCLSVQLACSACRAEGKAVDCVHMLHLVPRWQSSERHVRLKTIMQDRPDLIQSELSGLAFDSMKHAFRAADVDHVFAGWLQPAGSADVAPRPVGGNIAAMLGMQVPANALGVEIYIFIDPAAGGPQSEYALLSVIRSHGVMQVRRYEQR